MSNMDDDCTALEQLLSSSLHQANSNHTALPSSSSSSSSSSSTKISQTTIQSKNYSHQTKQLNNSDEQQTIVQEDLLQLLNSLQPLDPTTYLQPLPESSSKTNHHQNSLHPAKRIKLQSTTSPPTINHLPPTNPIHHQINHQEQINPSHDLSKLSLNESLPILIKLIKSTHLLDIIQRMKEKQDQLELRLIDERNRIKSEQNRALKKLNCSSNSERFKKLSTELELELIKFDQLILSKWDQLKFQQQIELENLKVPGFFQTDETSYLLNQKEILKVLFDHLNKQS